MKSVTRILIALLLLSQWKTLEAALLFEADFSVGKPGWTSVQPDYATQWLAGPLRWVFDTQRNLVSENSNIYSDDANASPSTAAAMFINDRDSGPDFSYSASIKPGDDDGAGLIFGYVDSANFFRISFGVQSRTGFPYTGWSLDHVKGGKPLVLAGHDGTNTIDPAFIPTRGQAFQVEIKVSSGTSLSISLTDGIGSSTPSVPIQIVNALALPESAAGKVGFFTWGQSGGNPPGVEFSSWSMEPNGMAGPDSDPLAAWQSVLPANAAGASAPSAGTWGLGFGANGPFGSLNENSNSFLNATSIEGNSHIDFSAPTYVAGETSWTDYTVTARIIPSDDDGHGLVLRYLDDNNFYRISLAGQADADGRPWQGLSVQKKVQGAWSQVFHDASRSFIPANNVPYDIVAQIQGNRLDIRIVNDPNGSATPYLFDPMQISGSSVDQGKVGFFSWGMNATEVDFIRVESSILLSENFNDSIDGWNIVIPPVFQSLQPGPLRWIQDLNTSGFAENSNFFTDSATFSPTTVPAIIINEALVTGAYTWKATLNSGDNDGYGVVFGYKDPLNFYRVTFAIQDRPDGYPWHGWSFDRFVDGKSEILAGDNGSSEFIPDFVQTATRAFRVIVQVDDQSNLTLDVLDDAASEFPIEIRLIDRLKLPVQPDGQVGIMVWGQSGGGNPPGALFTDFELSPFQLVNNPVLSLDGWISELPDNNVNEAPTFPGYWGLAFNQELGMWGTLNESSNAFLNATDVNGNTHVDFTAPTLVTGDASWTDYIVRTRLIPSDDDGHGILFRYQDAENFYRLSFAGQADADGRPWQGVSVQKKVNGVWSEVFHDETGSFIPANNVPFDVLLTVNGDSADLTVSREMNGQMETFSFGPFEFVGEKIDAGKVGFFSWGMNAFAADFLQVQEIEGIPLQVNSEFGNPVPPVGLTSFDSGVAVEATVEAVVNESESVRHVNIGYTGSGNVPASGATSSVSFSINRFSVLTWNWVSEYKVSARASLGGSVTGPDLDFVREGDMVTIQAVADTGYVFHGWSGDSRSLQNPLTLTVERPISLVAEFAVDSDKDGLPDSWELRYLKSLEFAGDQNSDKDNFTNQEELNRGSHPGFAEVVTLEGGFPSRWEDVKRDPSQSGLWQVLDFGNGFRGVSENTNDHRGADLSGGPAPLIPVEEIVPSVTFDGPRLIISQNEWNNSWVDYTIEATISIGDNDGSNVFVRYIDENNWIRVNMEGEDPPAGWRPPTSLSVQKRVNGIYSELATDDSFIFDPADSIGFKRYRVTVAAQGQDYEVRVVGFDTLQDPPFFNPDTEVVINFSDDSLAGGRAGIGSWGQSGSSPTALNPVGTGVFFEDFTVTVGNTIVFSETFDQSLLNNQLPEGWENPFASLTSGQQGDWKSTPHGLVQLSNYFGNSTGTLSRQKADVEGPVLLAKPHGSQNFLLEMTIQAFDDDGIGFVYDYIDENNYARVLLRNEKPVVDNSLPQGINISRKSNGGWNDIIVNDTSFIYQLGQPFVIHFSAIGQDHFIHIRQMDNPDKNTTLRWEDQMPKEQSRTGLHTWGMTEGHFWAYTISSLPIESSSEPLRISQVTLNAGQISLTVENGNATYSVEFSEFINATSWQTIASGQTSSIWIGNLPNNGSVGFWRIRRE